MRKPVAFGLIAATLVLLASVGLLFQKNREANVNYALLKSDADASRERYAHAIDEIASIQDSLNTIVWGDSAVRLLATDAAAERSTPESRSDAALARIGVLKAGIERNREKISQLDASLKKSGVQVSGLKRMVANLNRTVAEKEALVAQLSTEVESLQSRVTILAGEIEQSQGTIQAQALNLEDKRRELGTVYYMVGTKKELTNAGVVAAEGGVLGMGKVLKPTGNVKDELFTAIDTDQSDVIRIPSAKAQVLSAQPASSYSLQLVDGQLELRILDPKEFRTVKHLVIMTA